MKPQDILRGEKKKNLTPASLQTDLNVKAKTMLTPKNKHRKKPL